MLSQFSSGQRSEISKWITVRTYAVGAKARGFGFIEHSRQPGFRFGEVARWFGTRSLAYGVGSTHSDLEIE